MPLFCLNKSVCRKYNYGHIHGLKRKQSSSTSSQTMKQQFAVCEKITERFVYKYVCEKFNNKTETRMSKQGFMHLKTTLSNTMQLD